SLVFCDRFNTVIEHDVLPTSLTSLCFGLHFNQCLDSPGLLPPSLTSFTYLGLHDIKPGVLPKSLKELVLGAFDHDLTPDTLPSSITRLTFGMFNRTILEGVLPASLIHLTFGYQFNRQLLPGSLPQSLQHLNMGYMFKHDILPSTLPSSLQSLIFSETFHLSIEHVQLPPSLTKLRFGYLFEGGLPAILPPSLTHLEFGACFNQAISGALPDTMSTLIFSEAYTHVMHEGILRPSLTKLCMGLNANKELKPGMLPQTLTDLTLGASFNVQFNKGSLPASLISLRLGSLYNQPFNQGVLPVSLKHMSFGTCFKSMIEFPNQLQSLKIASTDQLHYLQQLPSSAQSVHITNIETNSKLTLPFFAQPPAPTRLSLLSAKLYSHSSIRPEHFDLNGKAVQVQLVQSMAAKVPNVENYRLTIRVKYDSNPLDNALHFRHLDEQHLLYVLISDHWSSPEQTCLYGIIPVLLEKDVEALWKPLFGPKSRKQPPKEGNAISSFLSSL
ncbi:hypothetical protein SAMD00019534_030240, partial [Acytostelium subglobosum LB1]|uniref:hypothetical protein n=1 Tax=Acytostelium subglobosum LB1 TaxID=1410327 RepID=UPI0006449989